MQDKLYENTNTERAVAIGRYVSETGATVRQAAKIFGISKSTAHKDLTVRLKTENLSLYKQAARVLAVNKKERHIRGGIATREKYLHMQKKTAE